MDEKIRILAWGDYCCATGFGTVMGNIMRELAATGRYEIDVVGINYSGDPYDTNKWPGRVWPALSAVNPMGPYGDVFGRQRVLDLLSTGNYDVLFMLQDTFIVADFMPLILEAQEKLERKFKVVYYYPLDATPKKSWITDVVAKCDFPVTYTEYARAETLAIEPSLADRLQVIYHGTNLDDFHYIEDRNEVAKFRSEWFQGLTDGKFLITNVNRNQSRKDIPRSLAVIRELRDRGIDDVVLYLHMAVSDVGGNIIEMANALGLEIEKDYIVPHPNRFNPNQGMPVEVINWLYNASDAVLTTTLGEGWGLSVTEAMATRTPVIAPNHTSLTEMLGVDRGYRVRAGHNPSMWITKEMDNERRRPLMDVEDAADAIVRIREVPTTIDLDAAYAFVGQLSWKNIVSQWMPIIDRAASEARAETPSEQSEFLPNRSMRRKQARKR